MKRRGVELRFGKWFGTALCVMLGAVFSLGPTPFAAWFGFGLLLAVPTLLMWWLDRPRRPLAGHCRRCGYNLRGLTEARCPECGAGFEEV